jgi:hypothetical protein
MRTGRDPNGDVQRVAAHQSAGRVYQHVVANAVAFWIKALQNSQGAGVRMASHALACLHAVIQIKFCVPGHAISVCAETQNQFFRKPRLNRFLDRREHQYTGLYCQILNQGAESCF